MNRKKQVGPFIGAIRFREVRGLPHRLLQVALLPVLFRPGCLLILGQNHADCCLLSGFLPLPELLESASVYIARQRHLWLLVPLHSIDRLVRLAVCRDVTYIVHSGRFLLTHLGADGTRVQELRIELVHVALNVMFLLSDDAFVAACPDALILHLVVWYVWHERLYYHSLLRVQQVDLVRAWSLEVLTHDLVS